MEPVVISFIPSVINILVYTSVHRQIYLLAAATCHPAYDDAVKSMHAMWLRQSTSAADDRSGDGAWCTDSGIGSSTSIPTGSSEKLSLPTGPAAQPARPHGPHIHASVDDGDGDGLTCCGSAVPHCQLGEDSAAAVDHCTTAASHHHHQRPHHHRHHHHHRRRRRHRRRRGATENARPDIARPDKAAPYRKGGHRETWLIVRVEAHYKLMC